MFGRIGQDRLVREFRDRGVDYVIGRDPDPAWLDEQGFDYLFWSWECNDLERYRRLFEAPRHYRILIFGQEQPQKLEQLRAVTPYADLVITSSPVYRGEFDGFVPFGIHDVGHPDGIDREVERKKAVLLSGSYRHSRGQMFDRLLGDQPFHWPVYLFPTCIEHDMVEVDRTREIVARNARWCYPAAASLKSYISELLQHLLEHSVFIDFTTNSSNHVKFHENLDAILMRVHELPGGYCPERVLDALWLGCDCFCLEDKAVRQVLGEHVTCYDSYESLVAEVNRHIEITEPAGNQNSREFVDRYRTSRILDMFSAFYNGGRLPDFPTFPCD